MPVFKTILQGYNPHWSANVDFSLDSRGSFKHQAILSNKVARMTVFNTILQGYNPHWSANVDCSLDSSGSFKHQAVPSNKVADLE